jgi:hypothetical protein
MPLILYTPKRKPLGLPIQEANIYLDFLLGSDSNSGTTTSAPVKTLAKASQLCMSGGSISIIPKRYTLSTTKTKSRQYYDGVAAGSKTLTVYGNGALLDFTLSGFEGLFAFIDVSNSTVTLTSLNMALRSTCLTIFEAGACGSSFTISSYCAANNVKWIIDSCKIWSNHDRAAYLNCDSNSIVHTNSEIYVATSLTYINMGSASFSGCKSNQSATGVTVVTKPTYTDFVNQFSSLPTV